MQKEVEEPVGPGEGLIQPECLSYKENRLLKYKLGQVWEKPQENLTETSGKQTFEFDWCVVITLDFSIKHMRKETGPLTEDSIWDACSYRWAIKEPQKLDF